MKPSSFFAALPLLTILACPLAADEIRIVDCDKPVKSNKRGVCINEISDADFMALAPGISWYYTWHFNDINQAPDAAEMEFIPMVWGDRTDSRDGLRDYYTRHEPRDVLAINELNLRGQAFIDPQTTARLFEQIGR
ncbi:MAG: glycosyl hydrolase, partial [Puniceicoccales bacterium]